MARYKSDFIIEVPVEPDIQSGAFNDIVDYNKKVAKKIRGHYDKALQLDNKREFRQEFKKLGKDIENALNLDNIKFSKLDELNLDKIDLSKPKAEVQEMINEYKKMAEYSQKHRSKVNSLSYDKILKDLDKLDSLTKNIQKLDITDKDDEQQLKRLLKDYKNLSNSMSRKAINETGLDATFRKQLKTMKDTLNVGRKYSTLDLDKPFQKLDNETKQLNVTLDKFGSELIGASKDLNKVEKEAEDVGEAFDKASNKGKDIGDKVNNGASEGSDGVNNLNRESQGLVDTFKKVSRWSIVAFAWHGFTNQIREAINYIKELDVALTEISVVTGKSREQVQALGESFNRMALRLGRTTAEVAKASKIFFRQGKTTAQVMELVEATTIAASVAHIGLSEASDYLTSTLNGFQMEAEEAMDVVDKFSAVGANAGTSFEEMAGALKKVAASANNANVDMDHMISYLATVSEVTREAPENIGTSFKTLFARMQKIKDGDMPEELNKVDTALRSIGITLVDQEGQIGSLQTIIEKLGGKWESLTKNQQAYIATSIAGTRQQVRFISLMDNYDRSLEILETSLESAGEAQLQFGQYLEGVEASVNEFKAAVENLYSTLTSSEEVNGFIDLLTDLVFRLQTLVDVFGTVGTAAGVVITFLGGKMAMSLIASKVNAEILTSTLLKTTGAVKGLSAASGGASIAANTLSGALSAVGLSLSGIVSMLGPVSVLVAVAWAAYEAWDSLSYTIGEINEDLKEFRDISNELNKMKSVQDEISKYEQIQEKLEQSNLDLEKRKELEGEIERLQVSIAGKVDSATTAYNKQGEAIAENVEKMKEAVKLQTEQEIFNLADSLEENDKAFEAQKDLLERGRRIQEEGQTLGDRIVDGFAWGHWVPDEDEVREARKVVEKQESLVSEMVIKWLTINDKTIDDLLSKSEDELNAVEKEVIHLVNRRGDMEAIKEYSFVHQTLPKKEVEKNAKEYANSYWDHLYDGMEEVAKKKNVFEKLKKLTDEQIESILRDPRGHEDVANFLQQVVESLDLGKFTREEQVTGLRKYINTFVSGTKEMKESAKNIDTLKNSLSDLSTKKDDLKTLSEMLDRVNESGNLNLGDLEKVEEMYDDFDESSATSIEDFQKFVQGKIDVIEEGVSETLLRVVLLQNDLTDQGKVALDNMIDAEKERLGVSIRQNMSYAAKIKAIREGINDNIEETYANTSMGGIPEAVKDSVIEQAKEAQQDQLTKELMKSLEEDLKLVDDMMKDVGTSSGKSALDIAMETVDQEISKIDAKIREAEATYSSLEVEEDPAANLKQLNSLVKEIDGYYDKKLDKIQSQINLYKSSEDSLENQAAIAELQANKQELLNEQADKYNRIKQRGIKIIENSISKIEAEQEILNAQMQTNEILYERQDLTKEDLDDLSLMEKYVKNNLALHDKELELQKDKLEQVKKMEDSTEKTQQLQDINNKILEVQNSKFEERKKLVEDVQGIHEDLLEDRESAEQDLRNKIVEYYEDIKRAKVEEVEEDLENFKDAQDEKLRMLDKYQNRVDRTRREEDRNKEMMDIQEKMNELRLVDTEASNKKLRELQEKYDELKLEKKRDLEDDAIETIQASAEEQTEIKEEQAQDEVDTIEGKYDDIIEEVRNSENGIKTILDDFSKNVNSLSKSLRDPFKTMESQVYELKGEYEDLKDMVEEAEQAMESVGGIDMGTTNKTYRDLNEGQFKELYRNKLDWEEANRIGDEEGMKEAQEKNQELRKQWGLSSGSAGISMEELKKLFLEEFNSRLPEYANGGISTSTQLAKLHGTPSKPEFIFNYDQIRALKDVIGTGSNLSVGSLVTVEGDVTDKNVDKVVSATKSGIQKLRDRLEGRGKITALSSVGI